MDCKFAFICDFAEHDGSKLHALGIGWDTVYTQRIPTVHPMFCFVAVLQGTLAEKGTKDVELRLIDADGDDVMPPIKQQVPFEPPAGSLEHHMNVLIQMGGLQINKLGAHALHLVVQEHSMAQVDFNVAKAPSTA